MFKMRIVGLLENTSSSSEYESKHGLSIYVDTGKYKILFDLGPDDTFIKNASKMDIDIGDVDIVVISHGHRDHGGGLKAFLEVNKKANIYIHEKAFDEYYVRALGILNVKIGLDKELKDKEQIIFTKGKFKINEELMLFDNPNLDKYTPEGNKILYEKVQGKYVRDSFSHEQNLIIKVKDKNALVAGCAHRGISNILAEGEKILGKEFNYVIGGYHLFKPSLKKDEKSELIESIGNELNKRSSKYYTCHCTGKGPYTILKNKMKDKIGYLQTGTIIDL